MCNILSIDSQALFSGIYFCEVIEQVVFVM